jgi:(p)ppGpp synthase/HD superfamily hydrolase
VPYTEKFERALDYAARLHKYQCRKGTSIPYITHLLAVASLVGENGGTEEEVVAALLHDAPEDQGGEATLEDIRTNFGDEVAKTVDGCTDTYEDPKPPWRERKTYGPDSTAVRWARSGTTVPSSTPCGATVP